MELDPRKQLVLRAIVTEYVRSAEPVGSERLAESHDLMAKAATIRNEMAALASLGYLVQPHTSAGRIPSDKGYRLYVDRLMEMDTVKPHVPRSRIAAELDEVLRQTCRILAGLTHCAAVATPPQRESVTVQQVHITPVTASRVLVVVLLSSGEVEHRIVELGETVPATTLTRLFNVFNEQLAGVPLEAARRVKVSLPPDMDRLAGVAASLMDAVSGALRRDPEEDTVVEGSTRVLREPEFHDEERRERLLLALENRRRLLESLRALGAGPIPDVDVTIGTENPRPEMQDFSFVTARYFVGSSMTGVIGIFGPTRMAYSQTIPAVRSTAKMLGDLLTRLSGE